MKLWPLAVALAGLLASGTAAAADPAQPKEPTPNRWSAPGVEAQLSYFGPTGLAGLALDIPVVPMIALFPGIGTAKDAVSLAMGVRLRLPVPPSFLVTPSIGTGFFMRPHTYSDAGPLASDEYSGSKHWSSARFYHLDVGLDLRTSFGLTFRVYAGARTILNPEDYVCQRGSAYSDQSSCEGNKGEGYEPYFGIALGYAVM